MKTRTAHPSENSPMYVGPRAPKVPVVEVREFSIVPQACRPRDACDVNPCFCRQCVAVVGSESLRLY